MTLLCNFFVFFYVDCIDCLVSMLYVHLNIYFVLGFIRCTCHFGIIMINEFYDVFSNSA